MALIKFGAIVAEARGKEGGMIFSRNKGGAYIKAKITPTNPQTLYQQAQRSALASIAQTWRTLTQAQRDSWATFALGMPVINVFGDQTFLSGFGAYCKVNRNLRLLGAPGLVTPAAVAPFGSFTAFALTCVAGVLTATWTVTGMATGTRFFYDMIPGIMPGKKFVKNLYRLVLADSAPPVSPKVMTTSYVARFGAAPLTGQRVSVRIRQVCTLSGWDSFPLETTTIATAT